MSDPNLKAAMEEIKQVLAKYDCAGVVAIQSAENLEYLYHLSPSWSCLWIENDNLLRMRALRKDFPTLEAQNKCIQDSGGMIFCFHQLARDMQERMDRVIAMMGRHFDITNICRHD